MNIIKASVLTHSTFPDSKIIISWNNRFWNYGSVEIFTINLYIKDAKPVVIIDEECINPVGLNHHLVNCKIM